MPIPNLMVVGCQKCGTTWLHRALGASSQIFATKQKELGFFNQRNLEEGLASYLEHFPDQGASVKYYMESTPHYFQLPYLDIDIARNIKTFLGNPKLVVIFRDPVERYLSAYTHHIMKDRLPYTPVISEFDSSNKMLELGHYGRILSYWKGIFPDISTHLYDRIERDSFGLITDVMSYLEIRNDIRPEQLNFRTNDKNIKVRSLATQWQSMPVLDMKLRLKLIEHYRPHVQELADLLRTDLSHWLSADPS